MKYAPGFVPINFRLAGKILLGLGVIGILLKGVAYLTGWINISSVIFYIGIASIIIGIYLIFILPKE